MVPSLDDKRTHRESTPFTKVKEFFKCCTPRIFANVRKTVLYCAMVRNSLQNAVFADFLLARNRFRTNYKATLFWDSSAMTHKNEVGKNNRNGEFSTTPQRG